MHEQVLTGVHSLSTRVGAWAAFINHSSSLPDSLVSVPPKTMAIPTVTVVVCKHKPETFGETSFVAEFVFLSQSGRVDSGC